jgi:hypothetical protein
MEELNICILKKQIYHEFDILFNTFDSMNNELFIQYIINLTNFYKIASSNVYLNSIELLEKMQQDYYSNFNIISLKSTIGKINNTDILLQLLSFFVGRSVSKQFIYP